jgi:MerR family transcriptional regulator, copper efflux regulator
MADDQDRISIIEKLLSYKLALEKSRPELLKELGNYYSPKNDVITPDFLDEFKDLELMSFSDANEAYILTQIKVVETMPMVINEHIFRLNVGDDIDEVLESFEIEVYGVKKDIYKNLTEWEDLLDHLPHERLQEITKSPKGYGDKILKELWWIRRFESRNLR